MLAPASAAGNGGPQHKHKYDLKVDGLDEVDRKIKAIYALEPGKYAVYVTDDDMLHTTAEQPEERLLNQRVDVNEERARIRDFKENAESLRTKYQNSYAKAMVAIMLNRQDVGLVLLRRIRENMSRFLARESIFYYLLGAATAAAGVLGPYLFFYWAKERFKDFSDTEAGVYYAIAFSCMGGFLSVATGTGKMRVDLLDARLTKFVYGIFRVAIAVFSGVLVFYLLKAGVLGGVFENAEFKSVYGIYVICAAAGFLEKLVPNAMLSVAGESAVDGKDVKGVDETDKSVEDLKARVDRLENPGAATQTEQPPAADSNAEQNVTGGAPQYGEVGTRRMAEQNVPVRKTEPDAYAQAASGK